MALLKDQPISCLAEWMAYDSKLSVLSEQESTSIESKSRLAQNEIETQLTSFLLRQSGLSENASRQLLNKIVVTEALARWHSMLTLSFFYIDLASLQNSTLHRDQSRYFEDKAESAKYQLFETGVGIVSYPVPKAELPTVISTPDNNPQRFLRARTRFVDLDGAQGASSSEFFLDMSAGESIELSYQTLPARCVGWLLYLGENSDPLYLATPTPVPAGTTVVVTPDLPALAAPAMPKESQQPERFIRYTTEMWR
jgi:hypothetical protein